MESIFTLICLDLITFLLVVFVVVAVVVILKAASWVISGKHNRFLLSSFFQIKHERSVPPGFTNLQKFAEPTSSLIGRLFRMVKNFFGHTINPTLKMELRYLELEVRHFKARWGNLPRCHGHFYFGICVPFNLKTCLLYSRHSCFRYFIEKQAEIIMTVKKAIQERENQKRMEAELKNDNN